MLWPGEDFIFFQKPWCCSVILDVILFKNKSFEILNITTSSEWHETGLIWQSICDHKKKKKETLSLRMPKYVSKSTT